MIRTLRSKRALNSLKNQGKTAFLGKLKYAIIALSMLWISQLPADANGIAADSSWTAAAKLLDSLPLGIQQNSSSVDSLPKPSELGPEKDIWDVYRQLFNKERDSDKAPSAITVIPNISANPTIGFQGGIKAVAGKALGKDTTTYLSVAATSASITTKGILYFYLTHNVFTSGNKYNFQGSIVASKSVTPDFGLGSRPGPDGNRRGYVYHSSYYQFKEKVYKELAPHLYGGAGIELDIRRNTSSKQEDILHTPYGQYNTKYGFSQTGYNANGFLFDLQYTSRDNQNRAYKGIYANAGIRLNQSWIGSTKNATQLNLDLRKYISLSKKHPEHVLALWTWSSFVLGGRLPYFELPGTGRDISFRSGRGYTVSFFKGTQFFYYETEYRFPITRDKLLRGVTFFNLESVNDKSVHQHLFDSWQPGAGAGLRILFNKATRTNLCLDYAFGRFGKKGFFLGLNEAF